MWSADPTVESELFNVHGIAHKVNFNVDISVSDATRDLNQFPLYDPLDDNSIEYARRQFQATTFSNLFFPSPPGNPTNSNFSRRWRARASSDDDSDAVVISGKRPSIYSK